MGTKPIASTLFRFVTLRNPKLLSKEEKNRGFIYYPRNEISKSHFLEGLDKEDDVVKRIKLLNNKLASFKYITKKNMVENLSPDLYDFSDWLMKNKNTLIIEELMSKSSGIRPLSSTIVINLWNNLHYQALTNKSIAVREAILRMIIADNFLKKNDIATTKKIVSNEVELKRLANAYVVIDDRVLNNHTNKTNETIGQKTSKKQFAILNRELEAFEAKVTLDILQNAKSQLKERIAINEQINNKAQEAAYIKYESNIKAAYEKATKEIDPNTELVSYKNLILPTLNYTPITVFNTKIIRDIVSNETLAIFNRLAAEGVNDEELLISKIENEIKKQSDIYYSGNTDKSRTVIINGHLFKVNNNITPKNSYSISAIPNPKDSSNILININFSTGGDKKVALEHSKLTIVFNGETVEHALEIKQVESPSSSVFLTNQGQKIALSQKTNDFKISGTITLEGEEVLEIDTNGTLNHKSNGVMINQKLAAEYMKIKHPGIKRIGIADFQRVDQEVCCYVPGEVSRIENILAKEYKERSTRQLISSETATETIEENEVERLTDTSTTERNELTSEVVTILNQDQSNDYGASAGVNGSFKAFGSEIGFYADAFYNGASSSSSSNSNSSSQTYAEEITRRALERVVQKVTKRRTSRVLREFEENNKHGFDNREGTEHVTGIYRWVDKIYTNKLINYGKRLVYEFNVPEPSRYFKEAIIETIEGENPQQIPGTPGGLIAPLYPQSLPFHYDASHIQEHNYQWHASRYNAIVSPPPNLFISISDSFSGLDPTHTGRDDNKIQTVAGQGVMDIPEGYIVKSADYTFIIYNRGFHGTPVSWITIGGKKSVKLNDPDGKSNTIYGLNIMEKLAYSYSAGESPIISGSITAKCERTPAAFKKWQDETFNAIVAAYKDRVNEYNDWLYVNFQPPLPNVEDSTRKNEFNPRLNRSLEKRELKRLAIGMLARPFNIQTAINHYLFSNTHPSLSNSLDNHAAIVTFFEQAFEWEIMAYTFYPYFYSSVNNWTNLLLESNGTDPIFQAFLQSGMARMVAPVRPGFEKAVTYFMETGKIMIGDQLAVDRDDDLYLSIAEEMEQPSEGVVEKVWETRVPTDLTIVQANSAPLQENGLPCCHNEEGEHGLAHGSSVMVGKSEPINP